MSDEPINTTVTGWTGTIEIKAAPGAINNMVSTIERAMRRTHRRERDERWLGVTEIRRRHRRTVRRKRRERRAKRGW